MNRKSNTKSKYVGGKSAQKVGGNTAQGGFIRKPRQVAYDKTISLAAKAVYDVLADRVGYGTTVKIGLRKIAGLIGIHKETVGRAINELEARQHIEIIGSGKTRRMYVLLSDVFGQSQGVENIIAAGPSGTPRYVSLENERHA